MSRAERRQAARERRPVPGVALVRVLHDPHCMAPIGPCSCSPSIRVVPNVSPAEYAESAARQADWLRDVRGRLS